MATLFSILFLVIAFGFIARAAVKVFASLFVYGLVAIGVLSLLALSAHH